MSNFKSQQVTKPSYVKTKAYGLCGALALATALVFGAAASADETTQPVTDTPAVANVYTADNAGNVTVTPSETVAPIATTTVETAPVSEAPATTTEVAQPVADTPATPITVTKEGTEITVSNPEVNVTFPNGNGKYSPFEVEYKDIHIPDDMPVNEGDKVVTQLPDQIGLQTSFDFDVYNGKNVVGKANADAQERKIITTFNNYFTSHPLNKTMSLKFDARWTDVVTPGKPVTVNFNGTVKTFEITDGNPIPTDEMLSKWGWQDKNDPQVINWTLRLNTARKVLNNAVLSDTWSNNQQFVDGSQNIYFVEDPLDWAAVDHSAKDYLESWNVRADGFDAKFKEFNHIMYIGYQTRLKTAVKDSTNPTNKATLTADDSSSNSSSKVQLVGGRGDASGENKPEPTFGIPREAPKVDIPEFEGGIPGIPEERELPPFEGGAIPNDAPILDLPELHIPEEPEDPTPNKPQKPSTPEKASKTSVERVDNKVAQSTTVSYKLDSEPKEVANTSVYRATLPNTGEKEGIMSTLGLVVIAAGITALTLSFKKFNEDEGE